MGRNGTSEDLKRRLLAAEGEIRRLRDVEAALRAGEERSGKLVEDLRAREAARDQRIARVGGVDIDLECGLCGVRVPECPRLHGLPPDRLMETHRETHRDGLARVPPEDRGRVTGARRAAPDGAEYDCLYRTLRLDTGAIGWIQARADIERAADGPLRLVGAPVDAPAGNEAQAADERRRLELERQAPARMAELRESEERFRAVAEQAEVGIALADRDGRIIWANARQCEVMDRGLDEILGHNISELTSPEDWPANERMFRRMIETGEPFVIEKRWKAPDRPPRWNRLVASPRRDGSGRIAGGIAITLDITDRKRVEIALRESEERLRTAVGVGRLGLWDWNVVTDQVHWSEGHFRLQGYAVGEVSPSYQAWLARVHPDDREAAERALERSRDTGEEFSHAFKAVHPDGSTHWLHCRGRFFYGDGRPLRMIGAMVEVTERREWEERQRALVAELQHRTRNLLGVVRSMSWKTARTSADLADFQRRFNDRLDALARAQGLLSRLDDLDRVTFDELIAMEFSAMRAASDSVALQGPAGVRLRSSTVQTLALALHELATNAMKYGALSQPGARLEVSWTLEPLPEEPQGPPWLWIAWRESGVRMPPAAVPGRRGQGRDLIERALPYQLDARTSYALGPDGVHCTIALAVSASVGR